MAEISDTSILPGLSEARQSRPDFLRDLFYLIGVSWLRPRRAAERCLRWPLPMCFVVHLAIGIVGLLLLTGGLSFVHDSVEGLFREIEAVLNAFRREPWIYSLTVIGIFVLIEAGLVALAGVVVAWGGLAGERLRESLRHSLRQVWLRTPAAVVIALVVSGMITFLEFQKQYWYAENPSVWSWGTPMPVYPTAPTLSKEDPGYAAAMKKFDQEVADWQAQVATRQKTFAEWHQSQPWYVRCDEPLSIGMVIVAIFAWLAGLLRAVGVKRTAASNDPTSMCLACGYDLSMTPMESRCPECGEEVMASLGEGAQPGAAWQRRDVIGRFFSWRRTASDAIRKPTAFGRDLQLLGGQPGLGRYMAIQLALIFLLGAAGVFALGIFTDGPRGFLRDIPMMMVIGTIFGTMCMTGTVLVLSGAASLVGWFLSLRNRRNLLPAAKQVVVYASPYLVAWALFGAVLINVIINLNIRDGLDTAVRVTGIHSDLLSFLLFLVPNAVCGLVFLAVVARGTNGARYANR